MLAASGETTSVENWFGPVVPGPCPGPRSADLGSYEPLLRCEPALLNWLFT
jgi:hypothetical protein